MRQLIGVLGTPIDRLNLVNVLERLDQFVQERRFHHVATANTDFLMIAISDPEFRHILRQADLVVPDGMPVVWASRMMGRPLPERVAGADIVPKLAALSAAKGYRIFMLGARPEVAKRAKERMENNYPGIRIVGCMSPPTASIIEMDSEAILEEIARADPDILLVAFGSPKQEKWIHMHRDRLQNVSVCIGVGATFDFIAGDVPRAPSVLQRSGFEWAYRLLHDPRRLWRRYARDLFNGSNHLLRQWWCLSRQHPTGKFELHVANAGECIILSPVGDLTRMFVPCFRRAADEALNSGARVILDLQGVSTIDTEAIGTLLNLPKRAAYCLQEVRMLPIPPALEHVLRQNHLDEGLYPPGNTVANAVTDWEHTGLYWNVKSGKDVAVVTVNGPTSNATADQLEITCRRLMDTGKRIDLDARGVTYIDTFLLATLYRLATLYTDQAGTSSSAAPRLRIACSQPLHNALIREKLLDAFSILDAPEVPNDASEMASLALEMRSIHRSGLGTQVVQVVHAVHREREPALSTT